MKYKNKKKVQKEFAKKNIDFFFNLIESNFYEKYNTIYLKEVLKISKSFNIRLKREEKLRFCRKCLTVFNLNNRIIRLNSKLKTKEYICKNCGYIRRFRYK